LGERLRLASASLRGLEAEAVDVEVDLSRGMPHGAWWDYLMQMGNIC